MNQNLPYVVDGKLHANDLKFQDLDVESNLLYISTNEDSDWAAIDLDKIYVLELENGRIWYKKIFQHINSFQKN